MTHPLSEELRQAANEELLERKIRLLRRAADALDEKCADCWRVESENSRLRCEVKDLAAALERAEARAARYREALETCRASLAMGNVISGGVAMGWTELIDSALREPETGGESTPCLHIEKSMDGECFVCGNKIGGET